MKNAAYEIDTCIQFYKELLHLIPIVKKLQTQTMSK